MCLAKSIIEDVIDEVDNCAGTITVAHVSDVSDGLFNEGITRTYSVTDAKFKYDKHYSNNCHR
jgi:hypothetical protein